MSECFTFVSMKHVGIKNFLLATILSAGALFNWTSCNQFEEFTHFVINYEQEAKIESTTGINLPFNLATPRMETNSEQTFENNDTKKEFIRTIYLDSLSLELFDPPNEDFSFLEEISIYIKAEGLDEVLIASKNPVPDQSSNLIKLDCTDKDLQEYIKADAFTLRLKAVTDEVLTRDHYFKIRSSYSVSAKLIN